MGMTDKQFISYRRKELIEFQEWLEIAKKTNADPELIKRLEKAIEAAKLDIETI